MTIRKRILTGKKTTYVPPKSSQKYRKFSPVQPARTIIPAIKKDAGKIVADDLEPDREEKIARLRKYLLQLAEIDKGEGIADDKGERACLNAGDVINYRIQPVDVDLRNIRNTAANARVRP